MLPIAATSNSIMPCREPVPEDATLWLTLRLMVRPHRPGEP
jgi:hypothetical protein